MSSIRTKGKPNRAKKRAEFRQNGALLLMMLPGLLYLVANNYLPMFGILIAFKKVDFSIGIFRSTWVWFDNFEFLFKNRDRYDNLIGETDPYRYLEKIKEDGYVTSSRYVQNTYAVLVSENLTRFDK